MIAKRRKATAIALGLGSATFSLLAGCAPMPPNQPIQLGLSAAAMRAYLERQNFNAWAPPPPHEYTAPDADTPPAAPSPVWRNTIKTHAYREPAQEPSAIDPPARASSACVGWWRICHFF